MNTRKILSSFVMSVVFLGSFQGVFAEYETYDSGVPTPPYKIQKIIKLEKKLTPYLESQINKRIQTLSDMRLKRFYLYEINLRKIKLKQYFENLQYAYSDDDYAAKLADLKQQVISIRDLIIEAEHAAEQKTNPFDVNETDRAKIEANILTGQKDIIDYIRSLLRIYEENDLKQNAPSVFHFEGEIGTIDVNFEKYTSITSWITGNQELDLKLTADANLKIPGGYEMDASGNYVPGAPKSLKARATLDGNMKSIGRDIYFTLRDYSLDITSDDKTISAELKDIKTVLDAMKGKVVHVALPEWYDGQMDAKKILLTFKSVLNVLEKESLLTPYKSIDWRFALEPKRSTLDTISKIIETDILTNEEYTSMRNEFRLTPLWYADKNTGYELWVSLFQEDAHGELRLIHVSDTYTLKTDIKGQNDESFSSEIRRWYVRTDITWKDENVHILWSNDTLDVNANISGQIVTITGPLSSTQANLTITHNQKLIGTIKYTGTSTHGDYEVQFMMDIPSTWKAIWKGTFDIERGIFTIDIPKNAVEFNTILPEENNNFESGAFNPLDL